MSQHLVLHQISFALPEDVEKTLTPQLLHPQLEQSPLQVEQLAQEQGAILIGKRLVTWMVFVNVFVCGAWWMVIYWELIKRRKKRQITWGTGYVL